MLCQILFNIVENLHAVVFCSLAKILFDAQQLVVFGNTVGTGRSTGLDLASVYSNSNVCQSGVFGFTAAVRDDAGVACAFCGFDSIEGFG